MKLVFVLLLTLGGASAAIITPGAIMLDPGAFIGAIFTVTAADYPLGPSTGPFFDDIILGVRAIIPPPLVFGERFVYLVDIGQPPNVLLYATSVPRTPGITYHVTIGNAGDVPYALNLGGKLIENPEPWTLFMLVIGALLLALSRYRFKPLRRAAQVHNDHL